MNVIWWAFFAGLCVGMVIMAVIAEVNADDGKDREWWWLAEKRRQEEKDRRLGEAIDQHILMQRGKSQLREISETDA